MHQNQNNLQFELKLNKAEQVQLRVYLLADQVWIESNLMKHVDESGSIIGLAFQ